MSSPAPRYDPVADWYVEFTKDWDATPVAPLPADIDGQRVADLACGPGRCTPYLAARGARVTGVDLSAQLVAHTRDAARAARLDITYVVGDVTGTKWWDGTTFDGVLCNLALMDIDDLEGALRTAVTIVRADGWFSFSVFHPCCPGAWEGSPSGLSSWPPDGGCTREGWWNTGGAGVRGRVGANHRMLSTYLNSVRHAGFELVEFHEPPFDVPVYFGARCRLAG